MATVEVVVAMVEVVVGMVEASAVTMAIFVALPAMASQLTKERTLQRTVGTEVTTGTEVATGAAVPIGAGTEIPFAGQSMSSRKARRPRQFDDDRGKIR